MSTTVADLGLEPLTRLTRDLANAAKSLSLDEVRYLVKAYYTMQDARIAAGHRERKLAEVAKPHDVISWLGVQAELLENQIKRGLDKWTAVQPVSIWARSICGIGPVLSAGLAAHIDIERAPTAGHIWAFAGLDPTKKWEKGEKRPFNADLKTIAVFRLGESFVKVQGNDNDVYGKVFAARKKIEMERNDRGDFVELAKQSIARFNKSTDAYKAYAAGRLPQARIHNRARRYAVKLFLAHYQAVAYFVRYGTMPPFPYVFEHLPGHVHFIAPPNADVVPGFAAALKEYEEALRSRKQFMGADTSINGAEVIGDGE